jgi:hypothetical protein
MASALQVSLDQLAELLTESENAGTTGALPADATMPQPEVQSEVWLGRSEFEVLIHPQVTEIVEAPRSAGLRTEDVDPRSSIVIGAIPYEPPSDITHPIDPTYPAGITHPAGIGTTGADVGPHTPVQTTTEARSWRLKRFAAAAVLTFVFAVASVPFIVSHRGPTPQATELPAPATSVAVVPGPDPASSNDNSPGGKNASGAVDTAPAASNEPTDGTTPPGAATAPARHDTRTDNRTISRATLPTSARMPAPQRLPVVQAAAYARSQTAALTSNARRTHLHPELPPRP